MGAQPAATAPAESRRGLLIVTTCFPPVESVGTRRITRICRYLDRERWRVDILAPTVPRGHVPPSAAELAALDVRVHRAPAVDPVGWLVGLRAAWGRRPSQGVPTPSDAPRGAARRPAVAGWQWVKDVVSGVLRFPDPAIWWLGPAVVRGVQLIRREAIEVVLSSSPPHSVHLVAILLKRLTGARLVVDFRDPWARSQWKAGAWANGWWGRTARRTLAALEARVVASADFVVLITEEMRDEFAAQYPHLADKCRVFPNGFDFDQPRPHPVAKRAPAGNRQIVFTHTGDLYGRRDPSKVLRAMSRLLEDGAVTAADIRVRFVGLVDRNLTHLRDLVEALGLADVVEFVPPVSYDASLAYQAESDVLLLLQPATRLQLPGKFYDYLSLNRPILLVAERGSPAERLAREGFGTFADCRDVEDIRRAVLRAFADPPLASVPAERRRRFDMAVTIRALERVLDECPGRAIAPASSEWEPGPL